MTTVLRTTNPLTGVVTMTSEYPRPTLDHVRELSQRAEVLNERVARAQAEGRGAELLRDPAFWAAHASARRDAKRMTAAFARGPMSEERLAVVGRRLEAVTAVLELGRAHGLEAEVVRDPEVVAEVQWLQHEILRIAQGLDPVQQGAES